MSVQYMQKHNLMDCVTFVTCHCQVLEENVCFWNEIASELTEVIFGSMR